MAQEQVLSVPDISCEHCVQTINKALGALPGVESVRTDIPTKTVTLKYDPGQVSMDNIEATLDDAGYTIAK
ncbi:MAG TPA: cation transporter [Ktedonobacterales bacterium]